MPKIELEIKDDNYLGYLKDPKSGEIKHYETLLSFYEANKLKRGNANVRPPESKKRPYKAMLETIENAPDTFHRKNRGITYICNDAAVQDGKLIITIPDDAGRKGVKFGIADGGHTFDVVARTVAEEKDYKHIESWTMPFVRVHFFVTRSQDDIEPIVEALNTSTQVQQFTLDEYQNKFSSLKGALEDGGFDLDLVTFRENEGKEWNVIEVIQRMACFLPERWAVHQPVNMYKSKNKALKHLMMLGCFKVINTSSAGLIDFFDLSFLRAEVIFVTTTSNKRGFWFRILLLTIRTGRFFSSGSVGQTANQISPRSIVSTSHRVHLHF